MPRTAPIVLVLVLAAAGSFVGKALAAERVTLTLLVEGAMWGGCAQSLGDALVQGGVKKTPMIPIDAKGQAVLVLAEAAPKIDLAKLGQSLITAQTMHSREHPPGAWLVLFAAVDDSADEKLKTALADHPALDAAKSKVDTERGELHIRLAGGKKRARLDELLTSLDKAGLTAAATR